MTEGLTAGVGMVSHLKKSILQHWEARNASEARYVFLPYFQDCKSLSNVSKSHSNLGRCEKWPTNFQYATYNPKSTLQCRRSCRCLAPKFKHIYTLHIILARFAIYLPSCKIRLFQMLCMCQNLFHLLCVIFMKQIWLACMRRSA